MDAGPVSYFGLAGIMMHKETNQLSTAEMSPLSVNKRQKGGSIEMPPRAYYFT